MRTIRLGWWCARTVFALGATVLVGGCVGCGYSRGVSHATLDLARPGFVTVSVPASGDVGGYALRVGVTEVTQRQYADVMGATPSHAGGCDDCPVERVSVYDAMAFANALGAREGLPACYALSGCTTAAASGDLEGPVGLACESVVSQGPACAGYRLPTRAEWAVIGAVPELADADVDTYVVHAAVHQHDPSVVGSRHPSRLGLFDTVGNVDEWLDTAVEVAPDVADAPRARGVPDRDPTKPWFCTAGSCFHTPPERAREAATRAEVGAWGRRCLGFRVVRTAPASTPPSPPAP